MIARRRRRLLTSTATSWNATESKTAQDWKRIADTLAWAEANLREPRVNCLETWFHKSRDDLNLMRATTTLALTHSDGYCLFSDPNPLPTPDHLHNWYPFWNREPGQADCQGTANSRWHREPGIRERHGGLQSDGEQGGVGDISRGASKCCHRQDGSLSSPGKS